MGRTLHRRVSSLSCGMLLALMLGGCSEGVLHPDGPVASAERTILFNSLGIMLAIVIPTILATLGVAWWFRASNSRAQYWPDWEFSGRVEMMVWSVPAMTVLLLGGIGWVGAHDLDPRKPIASSAAPITIDVVSLDWKWLFIYPEQGVASVNRLTIPTGTPIRFHLTSAGVMNSFFIPQLGSQIYTMAGMETHLELLADKTGTYAGLSAQFSGDGFADMRFAVDAVSPDQFSAWVAHTRGTGPTLDQKSYDDLARPSRAVSPMSYGSVEPDLFQTILHPSVPAVDPAHPRPPEK